MNRRTIAIALIAALLGGALGYWLAARRAPDSAIRDTGRTPSARAERQVLYWYDPMKPDVKFDKPGRSPYMDMPLLPRYADEAGAAAVRIDPSVAQNLGIRVGKVEKAAISPRLVAVGAVAYDERLLEVVQARVQGNVTRLYVKAPLERVRRGSPLAEILAPEWRAAQEEYLALLDAESERATPIRDAARERLIVLGVPEPAIRRIEQTRKADATITVLAPVAGVVTELAVREGTAFMAGAPLFRINGLDSVWVNAEVPEAQVAAIPPGSAVAVTAVAWPGVTFEGRVAALLPEVNPDTRTLPVRIAIDNPDRKLTPGMFVSLEFAGQAGEPRLVVPSEAVIVTGERSVVIVARPDGGFDVAQVTTGAEAGGRTAILSGLAEGQSIVLSGQFLIDSEASLGAAVRRLETHPHAAEKAP
ncbi:MAG TPA: efflux RND transporter periplasmic adaptor subunit [Steroidobacteraceae bacterium]|nr:efflux RND transporter periplasmic adaptor subunit [Steroidobacteraceae bacterium]